MAYLYMGTEMGALVPADGSAYESTNSAYYDANYCRASMRVAISSSYAETAHWTNATDIWIHADLYVDTLRIGEYSILRCYDSSDTEIYRLRLESTAPELNHDYWNGSSWTTPSGSINPFGQDELHTLDIHLDMSATGSLTLYLNGTKRIENTGIDLSHLNGVAYIQFGAHLITYWSQMIACDGDTPTVGLKLMTRYANGDGANTAWTGTYTDIDEAVYSDGDQVSSATATQVETFTHTGPSIPANYVVQAVGLGIRGKKGATGPTGLQGALRSGGTDYFSSTITQEVGYTANNPIWATDPDTAAAWTNTGATNLQFGVKSIA